MGNVILSVAISLDGFIEGPNGEYDWCRKKEGINTEKLEKQVGN